MTADRSITPGIPAPFGFEEDPFRYITRVYLVFLQGLFSTLSKGCYRWDENPEDSEIWIVDQAPIPAESVEARPAIVTMRGPCQFANLTLDNLREVEARTGKKTHTDMISGTMTLNCLAKVGLEAQNIAWKVMRYIRAHKPMLQKLGRLSKVGDQVQIGPETPPQALVTPEVDSELVNVPVYSPFFFQWTESVESTNDPLVSSIQADITARLFPPLEAPEADITQAWEQNVKLKRPTIRGVPLKGEPVSLDNPIEVTVKT